MFKKYLFNYSLFAIAIVFISCNSESNESATNPIDVSIQTVYTTPNYSTDTSTYSTWISNQSNITNKVIQNQEIGKLLGNLIERLAGQLQISDSIWVQLTEIPANNCPSTVSDCNTINSDSLKVASGVMVGNLDSIATTIRNQAERGACVAFALTSAMEIILKRNLYNKKLSEQFAYFMGKKLTNTWDSPGLSPVTLFSSLTKTSIPFVEISNWPYNPYQLNCDWYKLNYPSYTCSNTEAQGGGPNFREPDSNTLTAPGAILKKIHQEYASVGRIKQALYRGYPVLAAINANPDFSLATLKSGVVSWVLKSPGCPQGPCGHAINVVGYQDDPRVEGGGYFIIKNSWGNTWGDNGFAYCTYTWMKNSLLDAQSIVEVNWKI